jgi:hypothetical protein
MLAANNINNKMNYYKYFKIYYIISKIYQEKVVYIIIL